MAKGDPSIISRLVRVLVNQLQDVEYASYKTKTLTTLSFATGAQLDGIGEIVGEDRNGRDDAEYKEAIYFRIFANAGNGEPEVLITALRFITKSISISYREIHPAKAILSYEGSSIPAGLADFMQRLAPAGVKVITEVESGSDSFIYDSTIGPLSDFEGLGYSSQSQIEGGQYPTTIY